MTFYETLAKHMIYEAADDIGTSEINARFAESQRLNDTDADHILDLVQTAKIEVSW